MNCQRDLPVYFHGGKCLWPSKNAECRGCANADKIIESFTTIKPPTFLQQTASLTASLWEWSKAGFPVADEQVIAARRATCVACPEWDGTARLGAGKCGKCGCSQFKWWLATERCPLGKWIL